MFFGSSLVLHVVKVKNASMCFIVQHFILAQILKKTHIKWLSVPTQMTTPGFNLKAVCTHENHPIIFSLAQEWQPYWPFWFSFPTSQ